MSTSINNFFLSQGEYAEKVVGWFLEHDIDEVLSYAYKYEDIEKSLERKKKQLIEEILLMFKNKRLYKFRETGESFIVTKDFLEGAFEFEGDLPKFKRDLKKATVAQLSNYLEIFKEEAILR